MTENSTGFIPALDNYDSKKNVLQCMESDCFINVTTILLKRNKKIQIKFSMPNISIGEKIKIKKLVFYSNKIDSLLAKNPNSFKDSNLESFIISTPGLKYQLGRENENCVYVKINGELPITGELVINMTFE